MRFSSFMVDVLLSADVIIGIGSTTRHVGIPAIFSTNSYGGG